MSGVWRMSEVSGCVHGAPHLETKPLVPGKKMQTAAPPPPGKAAGRDFVGTLPRAW